MTKEEVKKILIAKEWQSGIVLYKFNTTSFNTNTGVSSQYDIEIKDNNIYLINSVLRNKESLLLTITEDSSRIALSPKIEGDDTFKPIILKEVS